MSGQSATAASVRAIAHGGSSKPAVMSVVTPPDSAAGSSSGRDEVDVAVDRAGRGDEAVAHDRLRVRADRQVDAVADGVVAGPADADDPPVLDADVRLDRAEDRVEDERPRRRPHRAPSRDAPTLGRPRPDRLGVAPDRLVAGGLAVLRHADPQVGVAEADPVVRRRAVAGQPLGGGEAGHRDADQARRSASRRVPSARSSRPRCRGDSRRPRRDRTRAVD